MIILNTESMTEMLFFYCNVKSSSKIWRAFLLFYPKILSYFPNMIDTRLFLCYSIFIVVFRHTRRMTCTAGARRVECTRFKRLRYSGGICEWQGALKCLSFSGCDPRIHRHRPERSVVGTVPKRSRCYDGVCEWQSALKYGLPGQARQWLKKIERPGMTCTAGARRVECTVLQRPRCYDGIEGALKHGSPGHTLRVTPNGSPGQARGWRKKRIFIREEADEKH